MILQEDIDFLAHQGVKGMRWGVTRSAKQKARMKNTKGAMDDPKTLRGTLAKRKEMVKSGELTPQQVVAGNLRFGRNIVAGLAGLTIAKLGTPYLRGYLIDHD